MKKTKITFILWLGMILISCLTACSPDDSKNINTDGLKSILLNNKWIMRDYSYGEGNDDHVWVDEESTTLYFKTESSGFEYWLQKDYDSDLGNSINKAYVLFDYEVSGNRVQITNEKGYNSTLYYREGLLTNENGDLFYMPSPLNSDDREFMAGIGPKEGKCGDNLYYEYNGRNRLTIKGSGRMYDYSEGKQPWADDVIETLTIEDGCTYIGKHAFNCAKIEGEISFPSTLEEIGEYAFYSANIVSLNISNCDRLVYIGSDAFARCPIYEYNFVLPMNLKKIGMGAFVYSEFEKVTLNEKLETIGEGAFGSLGSSPVVIPNSVKKIGYCAFFGDFYEIRLGSGIEEISPYAFYTKSKSGKIYVNQSTPVSTNGASVVIYYNEMQDAAPYWTLYVPKGSKTIYQEHPMWKSFKYIYEDNTLTSGNGYLGEGTLSNPFTPLGAASIGNSLAEGEKTEKSYYIKGKISRIKYTYSEEYGTAAFWISENGDATDEFYVYGCNYLGNNPWNIYNNQIYTGDDVVVYGKITNYKGIAETATKENYMYSHNGRTYSSSGDKDSKPGDSGPETRTFTVKGVTFKMKLVEAGTFQMGSTVYSDEQPIHSVSISKDYYLGETEVTQALWKAVTGYAPTSGGSEWSSTYGLGDNYPAYYINYEDVQSFITKLNSLTGENFRMPTEAEWEYAARGGNKSKGYTYSGSDTAGDVAWYSDNSSSKSHAVKTKVANELGIYDMSGNVWEWCSDWYDKSYYSSSPQTDPTGPTTDKRYRVLRGGCWYFNATCCRCAVRNSDSPSVRFFNLGVRLAL